MLINLVCLSGTGRGARSKKHINTRVRDPRLFAHILTEFESRFRDLAQTVDEKIHQADVKHFRAVRAALDILRSENVLEEAEQNPAFTRNLRQEVNAAKDKLEAVQRALQAARVS